MDNFRQYLVYIDHIRRYLDNNEKLDVIVVLETGGISVLIVDQQEGIICRKQYVVVTTLVKILQNSNS